MMHYKQQWLFSDDIYALNNILEQKLVVAKTPVVYYYQSDHRSVRG